MGKILSGRLALHEKLKALIPNVYFQPPENIRLSYPCFVYAITGGESSYADDKTYTFRVTYEVTLICNYEDLDLINSITQVLTGCEFDRSWIVDNLYHALFIVRWVED